MSAMSLLHHATLVRNDAVESADASEYQQDFDVIDQYIEKFGIDNARDLVVSAYNRPTHHAESLLIIRTHFITLEAQNALLKLLEEPPSSTKFIFVLPPDFALLRTLQSRFSIENIDQNKDNDQTNEIFTEFINIGYADRIAQIEKAIKAKDIQWQQSIKKGLIAHIKNKTESNASLKELEYIARTLLTRGASNKMLYEHLALTLDARP